MATESGVWRWGPLQEKALQENRPSLAVIPYNAPPLWSGGVPAVSHRKPEC
jgi:hypothetical protein